MLVAKGSDRLPARRADARPLRSRAVAMAKPLLPCQSAAHHSRQLDTCTVVPAGSLATILLFVVGAERRFAADKTTAGSAAVDDADNSTKAEVQNCRREIMSSLLTS